MSTGMQKGDLASGGRRSRRRIRGFLSTKTGRTAGIATIAAPIIGYIVNDLKKPDSTVRALASRAIDGILTYRKKKVEAIDITDKVEIIEDKTQES